MCLILPLGSIAARMCSFLYASFILQGYVQLSNSTKIFSTKISASVWSWSTQPMKQRDTVSISQSQFLSSSLVSHLPSVCACEWDGVGRVVRVQQGTGITLLFVTFRAGLGLSLSPVESYGPFSRCYLNRPARCVTRGQWQQPCTCKGRSRYVTTLCPRSRAAAVTSHPRFPAVTSPYPILATSAPERSAAPRGNSRQNIRALKDGGWVARRLCRTETNERINFFRARHRTLWHKKV